MKKERLFKLTKKDFDFKYMRGSGAGGQHRNKTASACKCTHEASGATGYAEDHREAPKNMKLAFQRMTETSVFKAWMRLKIDAYNGKVDIEEPDDFGKMNKRKVRGDEI